MGICDGCSRPVNIDEIRKEQCSRCKKRIVAWEIGFSGDIHQDIPRNLYNDENR